MYRRTLPASAVAAAALAVPAGAQAHVTLQPNTAQAGAFTVENVRVPNERDNASTVKVDLRLPNGFAEALYQPAPGWKVKVYKTKLAKPIQTDDGPVTEQVSRIVWTGDGKQGKIAPSQFRDFPLSVQIPGKAGSKLTFKALQTYSNGEVVRWIGPESADTPAPTVMASSGASEDGHAHSGATGSSGGSPTAKPAASSSSSSDTSASKGLGITALVVGASASWLVSPPSRSAGAGRPHLIPSSAARALTGVRRPRAPPPKGPSHLAAVDARDRALKLTRRERALKARADDAVAVDHERPRLRRQPVGRRLRTQPAADLVVAIDLDVDERHRWPTFAATCSSTSTTGPHTRLWHSCGVANMSTTGLRRPGQHLHHPQGRDRPHEHGQERRGLRDAVHGAGNDPHADAQSRRPGHLADRGAALLAIVGRSSCAG